MSEDSKFSARTDLTCSERAMIYHLSSLPSRPSYRGSHSTCTRPSSAQSSKWEHRGRMPKSNLIPPSQRRPNETGCGRSSSYRHYLPEPRVATPVPGVSLITRRSKSISLSRLPRTTEKPAPSLYTISTRTLSPRLFRSRIRTEISFLQR